MRQIPKTELSPDNGCIIDMKWKLGAELSRLRFWKEHVPLVTEVIRLPELMCSMISKLSLGSSLSAQPEFSLRGRLLERSGQLSHRREWRLAFLSGRILQG
jgi:hypothetical protein